MQVKVWLGDGQGGEKHYYVLSRYLICRMLTVTKLSHNKVQHSLNMDASCLLSLVASTQPGASCS